MPRFLGGKPVKGAWVKLTLLKISIPNGFDCHTRLSQIEKKCKVSSTASVCTLTSKGESSRQAATSSLRLSGGKDARLSVTLFFKVASLISLAVTAPALKVKVATV